MMTSAAENLCKTSTRLPWIPPSPEFHVLAFPHCLFGAVFQSYMKCLLGYSPHELMLSHFRCAPVFAILWTVAHQAPLSMGFSRQEYWSGLPWPPPGDLPNLGMGNVSSVSPALQGVLYLLSLLYGLLPSLPSPTGQGYTAIVFVYLVSAPFNLLCLETFLTRCR